MIYLLLQVYIFHFEKKYNRHILIVKWTDEVQI